MSFLITDAVNNVPLCLAKRFAPLTRRADSSRAQAVCQDNIIWKINKFNITFCRLLTSPDAELFAGDPEDIHLACYCRQQ
ncbi:TPA: hypothetical protein ACOQZT_004055 [Serratia odorifera]